MITTLIRSTRITWASKTLNMFLLALTYAYFTGLTIKNPYEILGGLILVCLLWGALYSLNDLTDIESDRKNPKKQNRAFIREMVETKYIVYFISFLIIIIFFISYTFYSLAFTLIMGLMLLNQILYTVPPFRLKNTSLAPFTSTATNSVLRIASCCILLGNILLVPPMVYLFIYLASLGTYLLYKEKNNLSHIVGVSCIIVLGYIFYSGNMNLIQFAVAVLPSLLAGAPLYLSSLNNKDEMMHLADIIYHKMALLFYSISILYLLIISEFIELI
jgi:hypothetical protein